MNSPLVIVLGTKFLKKAKNSPQYVIVFDRNFATAVNRIRLFSVALLLHSYTVVYSDLCLSETMSWHK